MMIMASNSSKHFCWKQNVDICLLFHFEHDVSLKPQQNRINILVYVCTLYFKIFSYIFLSILLFALYMENGACNVCSCTFLCCNLTQQLRITVVFIFVFIEWSTVRTWPLLKDIFWIFCPPPHMHCTYNKLLSTLAIHLLVRLTSDCTRYYLNSFRQRENCLNGNSDMRLISELNQQSLIQTQVQLFLPSYDAEQTAIKGKSSQILQALFTDFQTMSLHGKLRNRSKFNEVRYACNLDQVLNFFQSQCKTSKYVF